MSALLWTGVVLFCLLVLRFVQPALLIRCREFVVRTRINRELLELAATGRILSSPQEFGKLLSLQFRLENTARSSEALQHRCHKLRELIAVLTSDAYGDAASASVGMGLVELADMTATLGYRFKPSKEERHDVIDAEELLTFIAQRLAGCSAVGPAAVEDWLREHPLSVIQIGEVLVAAVYALTLREQTPALQKASL
jgi:hypothetical protein